ncbi:MAG: S-adenosylmethionine decarboxylase [Simkaniaceae bacterium]|nr:S-adenosylmethionine decarboxylase [Simkaniaceae bacterium]
MAYWGYHLLLDCKGCNKKAIGSGEKLRAFLDDLIQKIEMKRFGEPIIEILATHEPTLSGYSLMQLIETSSITGHFVDLNGDAYIDIFSCKEYDVKVAEKVVQDHFNPERIKATFLVRQTV